MLCLEQFFPSRSDAAAAASSRSWGRPGGPSMCSSYSTHLCASSCPVQRTSSFTSSVDTPSCSALSPQLPWACKEAPTWRTSRQLLQTQSLQIRSYLHRRFRDKECTLPWLQGVSRGDMSPVGTEERPSRGRCSKCGSTTLVLRVEALQI